MPDMLSESCSGRKRCYSVAYTDLVRQIVLTVCVIHLQTVTSQDCNDTWIQYSQTSSFCGLMAGNATFTLDECKQACQTNPQCLAIDYDRTVPANCFLHFNPGYAQTRGGNAVVDQWVIQRCPDSRCPSGWLLFNDKCYFVSTIGATQNDASTQCRSQYGAVLASLSNNDVLKYFYSIHIVPENCSACVGDKCYYWIGLTNPNTQACKTCDPRTAQLTGWIWSDPNAVYSSAFWCANEPSGQQSCALLDLTNFDVGCYSDSSCAETHPYICQSLVSAPTTTTLTMKTTTATIATITTTVLAPPTTIVTFVTNTTTTTTKARSNTTFAAGIANTTNTADLSDSNQGLSSQSILIIAIVCGAGGGLLLLLIVIIVVCVILQRSRNNASKRRASELASAYFNADGVNETPSNSGTATSEIFIQMAKKNNSPGFSNGVHVHPNPGGTTASNTSNGYAGSTGSMSGESNTSTYASSLDLIRHNNSPRC